MKSGLVFLGLVLPLAAIAEDSQSAVTPSYSLRPDSATLSNLVVLTRDDIRRYGDTDLGTLLGRIAGVSSTAIGTTGGQDNLTIRGADLDNVIVLIDGVRAGSAETGQVPLNAIPLASIARIEVIRGPVSGLYGANGSAGIIHIFTREAEAVADDLWLNADYSDHNLQRYSANFQTRAGDIRASGGINYQTTDGFDTSSIDDNGNADKDGANRWGANVSVSAPLSDALQLGLNHSQSFSQIEADDAACSSDCASAIEQEISLMTSRLSFVYNGLDNWQYQGSLGRHLDEQNDNASDQDASTERLSYSFVAANQISPDLDVRYGSDGWEDSVDGDGDYEKSTLSSLGIFGYGRFTAREYSVEASARLDDHSAIDDAQLTARAALSAFIYGNIEGIVGYGNAFRAPTLQERYDSAAPASDLEPEQSESFELALRQQVENTRWRASFYQTHYYNLIRNDPDDSNPAVNVGKADIQGVEFEWQHSIGSIDWEIGASYIEGRNQNDQKLTGYPAWSATTALHRDLGQLRLHLDLQFEEERESGDGEVDDLLLVGLGADYYLAEGSDSRLYLRVDNFTDDDYSLQQDASGTEYSRPGRSLLLGIEYHL